MFKESNQKTGGKKRDIVYNKFSFNVKTKKHFSGSSPPEIFVGKYGYPNINAGILSPDFFKNSEELAMPEIWHKKRFSIKDILSRRGELIYGRFKTNTKKKDRFKGLMQEIAMAYRPVSTEFFLKKLPKRNVKNNNISPIIANFAPLENVRLQENTRVKRKVDYLVSDGHVKSNIAINELHLTGIEISNINKILSAGLLGIERNRKLVPTRWSITAVDNNISKELAKKIRDYREIDEILLFHSEYNGNHYEILLLPDKFSFEVIEAEMKPWGNQFWQDYEFFHERKTYANNVVGAYYANKLALCEYLEGRKKQASALFFREARPEYYAPLGVGILRECCRDAFTKKPERFNSIDEAFLKMKERMRINPSEFKERSKVLENYGKQKRLNDWF
jgi:hypothetical protein